MADGHQGRRLEHPDDDTVFVRSKTGAQSRVPLREFESSNGVFEMMACGRGPQPAAGQQFVRPQWQTVEDAEFIDAVLLRGTLHERLRLHALAKGAGRLGLRLPVSRPRHADGQQQARSSGSTRSKRGGAAPAGAQRAAQQSERWDDDTIVPLRVKRKRRAVGRIECRHAMRPATFLAAAATPPIQSRPADLPPDSAASLARPEPAIAVADLDPVDTPAHQQEGARVARADND